MTQELIERLEPCPFCQAEPEDCPQNSERPHPHRKGEWCVYIWCDNCDARGPEKRDQTEAIAAWNTRDQSQSARIAELRETLVKCRDQFLEYERHHRDEAERLMLERDTSKVAVNRLAKAERNRQMAELCDISLTKDSTSG